MTLVAYKYTLVSRRTDAHTNGDALSRLPLAKTMRETPVPVELILILEQVQDMPVTDKQIKTLTIQDPLLNTVVHYIQQGWPNHSEQSELKLYWSRRMELCCFEGTQILIPPQGRQRILEELLIGHLGMSKMKALARTVIWWPKLDSEIEEMVRCCDECQMTRSMPPVAPLNPLPWPVKPWSRIHCTYRFCGSIFKSHVLNCH